MHSQAWYSVRWADRFRPAELSFARCRSSSCLNCNITSPHYNIQYAFSIRWSRQSMLWFLKVYFWHSLAHFRAPHHCSKSRKDRGEDEWSVYGTAGQAFTTTHAVWRRLEALPGAAAQTEIPSQAWEVAYKGGLRAGYNEVYSGGV